MMESSKMFSFIVFFGSLCLSSTESGGTEQDDDHQQQQQMKIEMKLKKFEVVQAERIHRSIRKRGVEKSDPSRYNRIEEVIIPTLDRKFRLFLTPKKGLLSSDFKAYSVEQDEYQRTEEEIYINPEEFFEGHLYGADFSRVSVHFDENNAITGSIETYEEIVMLEPAWRHVLGAHLNATIVYKVSDYYNEPQENLEAMRPRKPACGYVQIDENQMVNSSYFGDEISYGTRSKRQIGGGSGAKNRCPVKVIADYLFYEKIGGKSTALASRYLINLIDRVNAIYTRTVWQDNPGAPGLENQGLVIKEVAVHKKYTPTAHLHYNMKTNRRWNVEKLLATFTRLEGSNQYCLVHLFTYQAFDGGVLGLGYIASPKIGSSGGICSAAARKDGRLIYYNTALTSAKSTYGDAVITREADIVTAHEDVDKFCGNQRVEQGEECDVGLPGEDMTEDPCCTRECKLKFGKQCSPKNSVCCTEDCEIKAKGSVCSLANKYGCKEKAICNGKSPTCPDAPPVKDGISCIDEGECRNGSCISFCETKDMKPCICENLTESCYRCCRSWHSGSVCRPHEPRKVLSDYTTCIRGTCRNGVCIEVVQDIVQHLWNIIDRLDINNFSKFLEDNLVGTIILLSLVVWIPASLLVHYFDKKKEEERQKTLAWLLSDALVGDKDRVEVVKDIKCVNYSPRPTLPVRL